MRSVGMRQVNIAVDSCRMGAALRWHGDERRCGSCWMGVSESVWCCGTHGARPCGVSTARQGNEPPRSGTEGFGSDGTVRSGICGGQAFLRFVWRRGAASYARACGMFQTKHAAGRRADRPVGYAYITFRKPCARQSGRSRHDRAGGNP